MPRAFRQISAHLADPTHRELDPRIELGRHLFAGILAHLGEDAADAFDVVPEEVGQFEQQTRALGADRCGVDQVLRAPRARFARHRRCSDRSMRGAQRERMLRSSTAGVSRTARSSRSAAESGAPLANAALAARSRAAATSSSGPRSGQRQVAGTLLVVDDRAGEPPMGSTPFLGGSVGVDGRCEQGVRESNGLVVQPDHARTRPPRRDSPSPSPNAATPTPRGLSSGAPPPQRAIACPARLRTGTPGVNRAGSEGRRGSAKARPAPAGHRVPTMHARSPDRRRGCRHRPRGCEP